MKNCAKALIFHMAICAGASQDSKKLVVQKTSQLTKMTATPLHKCSGMEIIMIQRIKSYDWSKFNYSLLIVVIILCLISAFTVHLAGDSVREGNAYMKGQLIGMVMGLIIIAILTVFDYHFICKFAALYYVFGILLVAATRTSLGTKNGTDAVRWIRLGGVTFQPSELMKLIFIISLASMYVRLQNRLDKVSTLLIVAVVTGIPVLLILKQPDLSSSLVLLFIMVSMVFVAGTTYRIIAPIVAVGVPLSVVMFWYIQQPYCKFLTKYQHNRIMAWLHPETDIREKYTYQQNRSIRAIASGKLYGKFIKDGSGLVKPRAYRAVGVRESDFIWSIIGEEFGFLGCVIILVLLGILIFKCFMVARQAQDFLGVLIAVGVASMFMFQVFTNISVATLIFPNTGLPLPFLSNGLSSMLSSMIGIGLIMNIGIQPAKSRKGGFTMRIPYSEENDRDIEVDLEL